MNPYKEHKSKLKSCSFSELLVKINDNSTYFIGSVSDSSSLETKMQQLTEGVQNVVLGFDKANTHLYGIQLDTQQIISCASQLKQLQLTQVFSCMFQNKHILLLQFNPKLSFQTNSEVSIDNQTLNQKIKEDALENEAIQEPKLILNTRQKKTVSYLKSHKKITNRKFRDLFGVSHKTAHLELVELVEEGWIQRVGSGRSTRYQKSY